MIWAEKKLFVSEHVLLKYWKDKQN